MTTQTANEMAEQVIEQLLPAKEPITAQQHSYRMTAYKAALAMHARLTAEHDKAVAELVEGLDEIGGLVSFNGGDSNDMNVALDKVYDITQTLIAKHRAKGETE